MRILKVWYIDGTDEIIEGARKTEVKDGVLRVYDKLDYIEDDMHYPYPFRKHIVSIPTTALKKWKWIEEKT